MPKAEKGSVKDIANRMKSRGLQKLKFYCQMCEKQCRDANGFKCHLTSDAHLRQMKIFSDNAGGIMDKFSKEFERSYMQTLRTRHGTKKVNANNVYQEVISDKGHIHMNATHWTTLSEFVQYLGKCGKCVVEETERGWDISYIERDVGILARRETLQRREEAEKAAEAAEAQRMALQRIEAAKALDRAGGTVHMEATSLERNGDSKQIKVALTSANTSGGIKSKVKKASVFGEDEDDEEDEEEEGPPKLAPPVFNMPVAPAVSNNNNKNNNNKKNNNKRQSSSLKEKDEKSLKKAKTKSTSSSSDRKDYWLHRDILVRVITKNFDGKYFKRKAVVDQVIEKYAAQIEILDSSKDAKDGGAVLQLDQDDLETVIPKQTGKKVRILNGRYRGEKAIVVDLNKQDYVGVLELPNGKIVKRVPYEDFSKIA
ncbi:unnamed protein product [Cylindrotheca closterium]|uniref:C2H2-type domain-containing protein n=1 Tax=Cylindrotheca closterium TaxID=2856 RepID=A0AAD2FJH9_9STRA|nr:unnamed protein product [Cylindrotheca closterium]